MSFSNYKADIDFILIRKEAVDEFLKDNSINIKKKFTLMPAPYLMEVNKSTLY